ncbi:MAG: 3-hydroxyacyl-CoA dehydrogenase NAD-binding domain-containing protein [Nostocoides sp.]
MIEYDRDDEGIVTLTMNDPNSGANTMNAAYTKAMGEVVTRLEADRDDIIGVVLTSGKKTFFAGGNLGDLQQVTPATAGTFFAEVELIKSQLRRLERLGVPVVAAINGSALGGGLEIALACHYRIAADGDRIAIGLPEVTLGLLPGGGGVTRLVRMRGVTEALTEWLLQGQQYTPAQAYDKGVIDQLVDSPDDVVPAAKQWIHDHAGDESAAVKPWDVKGYHIPGGTPSSPTFAAILPSIPATLNKRLKGSPDHAPRAIISAAVEGTQVDLDTATRIESRYLTELVAGRESTAMIQAFFFDLQSIRSGALRPDGIESRQVAKVGVLGAGMMGAGIAWSCALAGIEVVLKDVSLDAAQHGKAYSEKLLAKRVERGQTDPAERDAILGRITPTAQASDLADTDVVIEAVFEDFALKEQVFAEVEGVVKPTTLLCSNTSTLPITSLQGFSSRPGDFVGLHFFSPVDKMQLVEIIRGESTSDEAAARAMDLVHQLRKIPIVVGDGRGFYTSRVFSTLIDEGALLVAEGVDPMVIERSATSAGFPSPPLAMLDEVSLPLTQHIRTEAAKVAADEGRTLEPPNPGEVVIDTLVELGRKGRAAGAGFYDYPDGAAKALWPGLRERWARGVELPTADIEDRYLFRMALETAGCFRDGILTDTPSANIGGIFGIGFPAHTGGPATFMTNYEGGLAGFVGRANELADRYGERFRPSVWLTDRVSGGTLV